MKRAIIIGASSGIGRELALTLSNEGYEVGITARRVELLDHIKKEIDTPIFVKYMDISKQQDAIKALSELIQEMNGINLIIICSGIGFINSDLDWKKEQKTINVNISGFTAIVDAAFKYFEEKGSGHIVGISSIAACRGNEVAPAYNASKAYVSNYLEGLRKKAYKLMLPITVTDIQPGFVDTEMAKGDGLFWVCSPKKAAKQIYSAIIKKKKFAYVSKRWQLIAFILKFLPEAIYFRL